VFDLIIRSHDIVYRCAKTLQTQDSFKRARIFYLRSLANLHHAARWLRFLSDQAQACEISVIDPTLMRKHVRTYGVANWSKAEQVDATIAHYKILSSFLSGMRLRALMTGERVDLVTLTGKKHRYAIYASAALTTFREGEIKLICANDAGDSLATLTFCLFEQKGTRAMLIGGLQGPRSATAKRAIITATRDLYGVRPKQAVFEVARAIAQLTACEQLFAVSNKTHVARNSLTSDYDGFWIERGAFAHQRFGFEFPKEIIDRPRGRFAGPGRDAVKADLFAAADRLLDQEAVEIPLKRHQR
jgi:uncharacterized protein VirK/YbjX